VLKDKTDESKGSFWKRKYDLHRIVIKKAHFGEMFNSSAKQHGNTKRVCGKF
jgi:hypothetical protein